MIYTKKEGFLNFTKQDILEMPKDFRKIIVAFGSTARVRRWTISPFDYLYEVSFRQNGYNILVKSCDCTKLKQLFIAAVWLI